MISSKSFSVICDDDAATTTTNEQLRIMVGCLLSPESNEYLRDRKARSERVQQEGKSPLSSPQQTSFLMSRGTKMSATTSTCETPVQASSFSPESTGRSISPTQIRAGEPRILLFNDDPQLLKSRPTSTGPRRNFASRYPATEGEAAQASYYDNSRVGRRHSSHRPAAYLSGSGAESRSLAPSPHSLSSLTANSDEEMPPSPRDLAFLDHEELDSRSSQSSRGSAKSWRWLETTPWSGTRSPSASTPRLVKHLAST